MTTRKFTVGPEFNLWKVQAQAEKLAARAVKKGLSGGYVVTVTTEQATDQFGNPTSTKYVVIEGEPVKFNGWSFVAKVEYVNGQPVVTGSPWYEGPQVDRSTLKPNWCDECGKKIARTKTIVVEKDGQRLQVGTSCVKDFLGQVVNPAWFDASDPFGSLDDFAGSGSTRLESLTTTLELAATVCRASGWVPSSRQDFQQTTAQDVSLLKGQGNANLVKQARAKYGSPTEEDKALAARALAFGQTISGDSDYAQNVRAILNGDEWFDPKYAALVVSVVGVLLKQDGKQAEQAADAPIIEEAFAEPKAKIEVANAVVTGVYGYESQWGSGQVIVLVGQGYRFKWSTSAFPGLQVGDRVDFKATVKARDEWNGQVSTTVVRLKVTKSYEQAAA